MGVAATVVCVPGLPLVPVLLLTQVLNAVLLLPLLVLMHRLAADPEVMSDLATGRTAGLAQVVVIVLVSGCVAALLVLSA
jgi:Mn2+/Fe2+ NRAMP family transporter